MHAKIYKTHGFFSCPAEAMHNATRSRQAFLLEYAIGVFGCLTVMNGNRQTVRLGNGNLAPEDLGLHIPRGSIPIVVQANLA